MEEKIERIIRQYVRGGQYWGHDAYGAIHALQNVEKAAAEIAKLWKERDSQGQGSYVSCDAKECLFNDGGECGQEEIYLNAYQICESVMKT